MDNLESLYSQLSTDGLYTKSFDEFVNQFSSEEAQMKLYNQLNNDGLYTKTIDDFKGQFFSDVKKKDQTEFSSSVLEATQQMGTEDSTLESEPSESSSQQGEDSFFNYPDLFPKQEPLSQLEQLDAKIADDLGYNQLTMPSESTSVNNLSSPYDYSTPTDDDLFSYEEDWGAFVGKQPDNVQQVEQAKIAYFDQKGNKDMYTVKEYIDKIRYHQEVLNNPEKYLERVEFENDEYSEEQEKAALSLHKEQMLSLINELNTVKESKEFKETSYDWSTFVYEQAKSKYPDQEENTWIMEAINNGIDPLHIRRDRITINGENVADDEAMDWLLTNDNINALQENPDIVQFSDKYDDDYLNSLKSIKETQISSGGAFGDNFDGLWHRIMKFTAGMAQQSAMTNPGYMGLIEGFNAITHFLGDEDLPYQTAYSKAMTDGDPVAKALEKYAEGYYDRNMRKYKYGIAESFSNGDTWAGINQLTRTGTATTFDLGLMYATGGVGLAVTSASIFGNEAYDAIQHNKTLEDKDKLSWGGIYANAGLTAAIVYGTDKFTLGNMRATRQLMKEAAQARLPKVFGSVTDVVKSAPKLPVGESFLNGYLKIPAVNILASGAGESVTETIQEVGGSTVDFFSGMYDEYDEDGNLVSMKFEDFVDEKIFSYDMADVLLSSFLPGAVPKGIGYGAKSFANSYLSEMQKAQFTVENTATGEVRTMGRNEFLKYTTNEENKQKKLNGEEKWKATNANKIKAKIEALVEDVNSKENTAKREELKGKENEILSLGKDLEKLMDEGGSDQEVAETINRIATLKAEAISLHNGSDYVNLSSRILQYIGNQGTFTNFLSKKGYNTESQLNKKRSKSSNKVKVSKVNKNAEIENDSQLHAIQAQVNSKTNKPSVVTKESKQVVNKGTKVVSKAEVEVNTFSSLAEAQKAIRDYKSKKVREKVVAKKQVVDNNVENFKNTDVSDLGEISKGDFDSMMDSGDYHIISAEKAALSPEQNAERVKNLEKRLKKEKKKYKKVTGSVNGKSEVSFIVEGMTDSEALNVGDLVGQKSVLSGKSGMIYSDGSKQSNLGKPIIDVELNDDSEINKSKALNQEGSFILNVDGKKVAIAHVIDSQVNYKTEFNAESSADHQNFLDTRVPKGKAKFLAAALKFINKVKGLNIEYYENSEAILRDKVQQKYPALDVKSLSSKELAKYTQTLSEADISDATSRAFYMKGDGKGTITVNLDKVKSNTLFHELGHPIHDFLEENDIEAFVALNKELKNKKRWVMDSKTGLPTEQSYYEWAKGLYKERAIGHAQSLLDQGLITKGQFDYEVDKYIYGEAFSEFVADASAQKVDPKGVRAIWKNIVEFFTGGKLRDDVENLNLEDLSDLDDFVDNISTAFTTGQSISHGDVEFEVNQTRAEMIGKTNVSRNQLYNADKGSIETAKEVASGPVIITPDIVSERGPNMDLSDIPGINREVDMSSVEFIDPEEIHGENVFVSAIDKSNTAMITSPTGVSQRIMGGMLYSMQNGTGIWAFTVKSEAEKFMGALKDKGVSRVVLMTQADTGILGNLDFNSYFVKEVENSIEKGLTTEEEFLASVNEKLNLAGSLQVRNRLASVPTKANVKKGNTLPPVSLPITSISDYNQMLVKLGTTNRNNWNKIFIAQNVTFLDKAGIPRVEEMYKYVNEPILEGAENGDLVATIELDLNAPVRETKEGDVGHHAAYPFVVEGSGLKVFNKYVDVRDAYPKFKVNEASEAVGDKRKDRAAKSMAYTTQTPSIKTKRYQAIGENARMSVQMKDNYSLALHMEDVGENPNSIKRVTMWEKGSDGIWRYEIQDGDLNSNWKEILSLAIDEIKSKVDKDSPEYDKEYRNQHLSENTTRVEILNQVQLEAYGKGEALTLKDILDDDVLFYYRELGLGDVYVDFAAKKSDELARFDPSNNLITVYVRPDRTVDDFFSSLKHEIQHWIQEKEGWPIGSNEDVWSSLDNGDGFMRSPDVVAYNKVKKQRDKDLKHKNSFMEITNAFESYTYINEIKGGLIDDLSDLTLEEFVTKTDNAHIIQLTVLEVAKNIPASSKIGQLNEAISMAKNDSSNPIFVRAFEKVERRQKRLAKLIKSKVEPFSGVLSFPSVKTLMQGVNEVSELRKKESSNKDNVFEGLKSLNKKAFELEKLFENYYDPYQIYLRVAGEVEARAVQDRLQYNDQQRVEELIQDTEIFMRRGVASEEKILMFRNDQDRINYENNPERLKEALREAREQGVVPKRFQLTEDSDTFDNVLSNLNLNQDEVTQWRKTNKKKRKKRKPTFIIQQYSNQEISFEEYTAELRNVFPYMYNESTSVPEFTSFDLMAKALNRGQVPKGLIGFNKKVPDGTRVGSRLDINANGNFGVLCNSIHTGDSKGSIIGYSQFSLLTDVTFRTNPSMALKIGLGKDSKSPFARMEGNWNNATNEEVKAISEEMLQRYKDGENIVQVSMRPDMASYFFDKKTGLPLGDADRVVQIGGFILAENPTLLEPSDPRFMAENSDYPGVKRYQAVEEDYNGIEAGEFRSNSFEAVLNASDHPRQANQWIKLMQKFPGAMVEINYTDLETLLNEYQTDNNLKSVSRGEVLQLISASLTKPAIASVVKGTNDKYTYDDFSFEDGKLYLRGTYFITLDDSYLDSEGEIDPNIKENELIDDIISATFEGKDTQGYYGIHILNETYDHDFGHTKWGDMVLPGGDNYREVIVRDTNEAILFPSNLHWQHLDSSEGNGNNVLVHVRTDDRIVNGKKILFIQEIQSDWAQRASSKTQSGDRRGFEKDNPPLTKDEVSEMDSLGVIYNKYSGELNKNKITDPWVLDFVEKSGSYRLNELTQIVNQRVKFVTATDENTKSLAEQNNAKLTEDLINYQRYLQLQIKQAKNQDAVRDMPWGKTQHWLGLGFRKAIDMAMKEGYDGVALVNGEMSKKIEGHSDDRLAEFYNRVAPKELVKQVRRLDGGITTSLLAENELVSEETPIETFNSLDVKLEVEGALLLAPMGVSESDWIDHGNTIMTEFLGEIIFPPIRNSKGDRSKATEKLKALAEEYGDKAEATREEWRNSKAGPEPGQSADLFNKLNKAKVEAAAVQYAYNQFRGSGDLGSALRIDFTDQSKQTHNDSHGLTRYQVDDNDSEFLGFSSPGLNVMFAIRKGLLRADYELGRRLTRSANARAGFTSTMEGGDPLSNPLRIRATEFLSMAENNFQDPEMTEAFEAMHGEVAVALSRAKRKAFIFKKAFLASTKGWTPKQLTNYLRGYEEVVLPDGTVVRNVLDRNDLDEVVTIDLRGVPTEVNLRDLLVDMRNDIDKLSQEGLDSGAFDGKMALSVAENLDTYLHRMYKKHELDKYEVSEENVERSKSIIRRKIIENTSLDPVVDAVQIEQLVETAFKEIFSTRDNYSISEDGLTPSQVGIAREMFKSRQDIPMEIRELMGEIHDPMITYLETISGIQKTISTHSMLDQMQQMGEGRFWSSEVVEGTVVANGLSKRLGSRFGAFEGQYVSDEVFAILNNVYQDNKTKGWAGALYGLTLMTKWSKTVGNIPTHLRNLIGNVAFVIQAGHIPINPQRIGAMVTSLKVVVNNFRRRPEAAKQEIYEYLKSKGVMSTDTEVGLIEDVYNDLNNSDFDLALHTIKKTNRMVTALMGVPKGIYRGMNKIYQSEDEIFKIYGFLIEEARNKKAGLSDMEAREKAVRVIKNTYPNYSKIPNLVRKIGKIPFFGTFVAFQSESLRVSFNAALLAKEEMASDNPVIRRIGAERAAGVLANNLLIDGIYSSMAVLGLGYFAGEDEEEEELYGTKLSEKTPSKMFRLAVPHYNKTGNLSVIAKGFRKGDDAKSFDGQLNNDAYVDFFDSSKIDGTGFQKNMMRVIFGETPIEEFESMPFELYKEFVGPFLSPDITVQSLSDAKDLYEKLEREGYSPIERIYEVNNLLMGDLLPSSLKNTALTIDWEGDVPSIIESMYKIDESQVTPEQAVLRLTGITMQRLNVNKALYYGVSAHYGKMTRALESQGISYGELGKAEFLGVIGSDEDLRKRMIDIMNLTTTLKHYGDLHEQDIDAVFNSAGVTSYVKDYILMNKPTWNQVK